MTILWMLLGFSSMELHGQSKVQELHGLIIEAKKSLDEKFELLKVDSSKALARSVQFDSADLVAQPVRKALAAEQQKIAEIDSYYYLMGLPEKVTKELKSLDAMINAAQSEYDFLKKNGSLLLQKKAEILMHMRLYRRQKWELGKSAEIERRTKLPPDFIPQGVEPSKFKVGIESKCAEFKRRLAPLDAAAEASGEILDMAFSKKNNSEKAYVDQLVKYYKLLALMHTKYRPVYVNRVLLSESSSGKVLYDAKYVDKKKLQELDKKLAYFMNNVDKMAQEVEKLRLMYVNAEVTFKDSYTAWEKKYVVSTDLMYSAYKWKVGVEFAEVVVSATADGWNPASLLFEAGFRSVEAVTGDHRITDPEVPLALLELRKRVSEKTNQGFNKEKAKKAVDRIDRVYVGNVRNITRWRSMSSAAKLFNTDGQADSLIKAGVANTSALFFAEMAQHIAHSTDKFHNTNLAHIMAAFMVNPNLKWRDYLGAIRKKTPIQKFKILSQLVKKGVPDKGDAIIKRLTEVDSYKSAGKGVALGVLTTAAKGPVMDWAVNTERAKVAAELVMLDTKWMIRRLEYESAGKLYRRGNKRLKGFIITFGELLDERDKVTRLREHKVMTNIEASATDDLDLVLMMSDEVNKDFQLYAHLNSKEFKPGSTGVKKIEIKTTVASKLVKGTIFRDSLKEGELSFIVVSLKQAIDHDPLSVARYDSNLPKDTLDDRLWLDSGRTRYMSDKLTVVEPKITLLNEPKSKLYPSEAMVKFLLRVPEALRGENGWVHVYKGMLKLSEVKVGKGLQEVEGSIRAPKDDGVYRLEWVIHNKGKKATVMIGSSQIVVVKKTREFIGPVFSPLPPLPLVLGQLRGNFHIVSFPGDETAEIMRRRLKWDDECKKERAYWATVVKKEQAYRKKWQVIEKRFRSEQNLMKQKEVARSMSGLKAKWEADRLVWKKDGEKYVPTEARDTKKSGGLVTPIAPIQPLESIRPL